MKAMSSRQGTMWLTLVVLGLIFGSAFLSVKVLVDVVTPLQVVAGRLGLAAAAVLVVLALRRSLPRPSRTLLVGGVVLALFDCFLPYALIAWASQDIPSGTAAVLMSTLPLFTAVFASRAFADERWSAGKGAGLLVGFCGVAVLVGPEAFDVRHGVGLSHAAVIAAAISYATAAVYARVLCRTEGVVDVTAVELTLGAVFAVGLSAAVDGPPSGISLGAGEIIALIALGVVSTGLGRLVYLWAIKEAGSVRASLVTYIIPVSALTLGWLVLGETIGTSALLGTTLIVAGVGGVMLGDEPWRALGTALPPGRGLRAAGIACVKCATD